MDSNEDPVERMARISRIFGNSSANIQVHASGYGTTLTLLILLSIVLGFAYIRIQARIDGLYDRLDAIYMMAPALQHQITTKGASHEH